MSSDDKQQTARRFLSVLGRPDESILREVVHPEVVWTFPGSSPISGEARGIERIMQRARTIAAHQVKVEILHATFSRAGDVSMILHNTGTKNGRPLDEYISAVFAFEGNRIVRLDTYLSDVAMADAYFS